jgi:hypothetical protein
MLTTVTNSYNFHKEITFPHVNYFRGNSLFFLLAFV